jgi:hypothetical protein
MKLPLDIIYKIESYCDVYTKYNLLFLNKNIRKMLLSKYYGYVLYTKTSNLVYDNYHVTIHKNHDSLLKFIEKNTDKMHIKYFKVKFTCFGRNIVDEFTSMRIFDETSYIVKKINNLTQL